MVSKFQICRHHTHLVLPWDYFKCFLGAVMWPDKARTHVTVGHISCGLPEQAPVSAAGSAVDRLSFQQCGSHWFCMVDLIYLQLDNTVVYPGRVQSLESLRACGSPLLSE